MSVGCMTSQLPPGISPVITLLRRKVSGID